MPFLRYKNMKSAPEISTVEKVLLLIRNHPEGITIKIICDRLNRPVSMVQICLKQLVAQKKIRTQLSTSRMHLIYYPF